jgi:hypothetical protein
MTPKPQLVPLHVVEDATEGTAKTTYSVEATPPKPVATIPPVPQNVISPATKKQMMRAMVNDGRIASTGIPAAYLFVAVVAVAIFIGLIALAVGAVR